MTFSLNKMSLLHEHSTECLRDQLDLFTLPPSQTAIESGQWTEHGPLSTVESSPTVEFYVAGNSEEYIDLSHTLLYMEAKIQTAGNAAIGDAHNVGPVNNFMHSMFSQVDVFLNEFLVSSSTNTYAYRALIENLFNYGSDAKKGKLTAVLFKEDTSKQMDTAGVDAGNTGLMYRTKFVSGGKTVDMVGPIHSDMFFQNRLLLSGVSLRVRLTRSPDRFALMSHDDNADYRIRIPTIRLFVRKLKLVPSMALANEKMLTTTTMKYPVSRVDCKVNTLSQGIMNYTHDFNMGQIPKRIVLAFVDNSAFNGDFTKNPFNFQHFNVTALDLYNGKERIPWAPLNPSFTTGNAIRSFFTQFTGGDGILADTGHVIDRETFCDGYTLYCFDLTPDLSSSCGQYVSLIKSGTVRVCVKFGASLASTINMLLYCEYDNLIEITKDRQVIYDYKS